MTNATRRSAYYKRHREKILSQQKTPEAREHDRQLHAQRKDEINARRREIYKTKQSDKLKAQRKYATYGGKENVRAAHKRWYAKHREEYLSKQRKKYAKDKQCWGKTYAESWDLARKEKAAGRPRPEQCEVCGGNDRIEFDHRHQTGAFRGWICSRCNKALGNVRDDPGHLRKLIAYLEHAQLVSATRHSAVRGQVLP